MYENYLYGIMPCPINYMTKRKPDMGVYNFCRDVILITKMSLQKSISVCVSVYVCVCALS